MIEKYGNIYKTTDYDIFKKLIGNRDVGEDRVKKVTNSIEKIGLCNIPLLVNEKMEVIDGQARLEACRRMGLPVTYIIENGLGQKQCIGLNNSSTNWKTMNYIESYAEEGNVSYMYFKILCDRFRGQYVNIPIIHYAVKLMQDNGARNSPLTAGKFTCSEEEYEAAVARLEWLIPIIRSLQGSNNLSVDKYSKALLWLTWYLNGKDQLNRLVNQIYKRQEELVPVLTVTGALDVLEKIYNYGARNKIIGFATRYKIFCEKNNRDARKKGAKS